MDGCFVGANFPETEAVTRDETRFDANKKASSPNTRKARWHEMIASHKGKIDLELAKSFENDEFDAFARTHGANERTLCGRVEISPRGVLEWDWPPFYPGGTVQSKVTDGTLAAKMAFWGQAGHAGSDFLAEPFLKEHKEYNWMRGLLKDMKCCAWTRFQSDGN
jgi:hypothetical protein